ncbi:chromosome segregation protein SMC [Methylotenera sp. G11]|uniref:chromosome segregation protein SMC n=1 Tax=Methylotenera sp. G11 TaxID=1506585 RepID=UPI000646B24C|nr:chromosome segregation protein SMC [Methylotenera sp. G11]
MRLTHLKLAGFKSFVDPTTLHIHGQRVGIVGPNGCGKSNVMESVRWVLGESSAREMRADAMDAVIFNGSGNRKSISRASVELVFDNSMGSAGGEWSQYAEISVKRVIERDKGSTYYINNTVVRRRDVADLFLGTGLGGRAYAIIGQNTISRIVEARPEEMRVFLEEAAGITKYKERRRETELRLRDTRDNLTRVEDVLRELDKQILRLQSQAVVAAEYHRLQAALSLTQGQIWLLKKREASAGWEKAGRIVEKLVNELEAKTANLRSSENALETARQQHIAATEAVNAAQASYYEANATVSTLENQVRSTADARDRMQQQLQQLLSQLERNAAQHANVESSLLEAGNKLLAANADLDSAESLTLAARDALTAHTKQYHAALADFNASQSSWLESEQRLRLEQANIGHVTRAINDMTEQLKRLRQNLSALEIPANESLVEKQAQLEVLEAEVKAAEARISDMLENEAAIREAIKTAREYVHEQQRSQHVLEAEINSLSKIQQAMHDANNEAALASWLKQSGLNNNARIWQLIGIQSGWETALESVLGSRLNALVHKAQPETRPPTALSVAFSRGEIHHAAVNAHGYSPIHSVIERIDATCQAVLHDWLAGVYLLTDDMSPAAASQQLNQGECLVNRHGDIYTRNSVDYFGAQSLLHGVLERQARLELLQRQLPEHQQRLAAAASQLTQLEAELQESRTSQHTGQQHLKSITQQAHQLNLNLQQLKQQQLSALQRKDMLETDSVHASKKLESLQTEKSLKEAQVAGINADLSQMQTLKSANELNKKQAEKQLNATRSELQALERAHQEKAFNIKLIQNNIKELESKIQFLHEEKSSLRIRGDELETALTVTPMETLKANLEAALNVKHACEDGLAAARNALAECQEALMQQERTRLQNEQMLHPVRDKLEAGRLNEQEARLHFEQCQAGLASCGMDEAVLADSLQQHQNQPKTGDLESMKGKLEADIEALGAVNLAAIDELASEQTRKQYLDSQCLDLTDASQTLEDAIRKIDRETRSRLQATFDEANLHFNELFTTLFGGGQARLVLLGDEILDTGMQVFAQPPGKKNSTIQLLSGGEKALTALALVFAFFRLNPAPFCLMDEVDAPLDDSNTERFCAMVKKMSERTQFLYVSHNKITMEMAQQLIGVTMQESGVSRIVDVDMDAAVLMAEA